jgi:ABC-type nitrate/sulfonate/bicarbonate transport system substrate-binding protein
MDSSRRQFLTRSTRLIGGTLILGPAILAACGSDSTDATVGLTEGSSETTVATVDTTTALAESTIAETAATAMNGAETTAALASAATASLGTVRTAFNWVPDVEWSAWYLADTNALFAANGVTAEFVHGGPNTPAVAQVVASGQADIGVATDELQLIKANKEGADFVILGAMYQKSPNGMCWLTKTPISSAKDMVAKKLGLTAGDEIRVDAIFKVNGIDPNYVNVPMSYDPQPLIDGDVDAITCYVTNQPIQLKLKGIDAMSMTNSDLGLKAYGDVLFASKKWLDANRELAVAYLKGLIGGVGANVADPLAVVALIKDKYGKDAEVDSEYSKLGNPAYIALLESDFTKANGLLAIDPTYLENEVYKSYNAAGETGLPPVGELLDTTVLADAHK